MSQGWAVRLTLKPSSPATLGKLNKGPGLVSSAARSLNTPATCVNTLKLTISPFLLDSSSAGCVIRSSKPDTVLQHTCLRTTEMQIDIEQKSGLMSLKEGYISRLYEISGSRTIMCLSGSYQDFLEECLRTKMSRNEATRTYDCTLCGKQSQDLSIARFHLESKHFPNYNGYNCEICSKFCKTKNALACHKVKCRRVFNQ